MNTIDTTITAREAAEIRRANESGKQPVLFVHGLWLLHSSWDAWRAFFEDRGYVALAADWPGDPADVEAARADASVFAGNGVQEVTDHVAEVARALTLKPIVIGHSFGGLLAQRVADLGLAARTIAIDPAPFKGVLPLPYSALKAAFPVLGNPANRGKAVTLTFDQFRYGFANAVSEDEARALYEAHHVAGPGRPLFQAAAANLNPKAVTTIDVRRADRGPLLIMSGQKDNIVPFALAHAAFRLQSRNPSHTEFYEVPGRGHSLVLDSGWKEVAEVAYEFARQD